MCRKRPDGRTDRFTVASTALCIPRDTIPGIRNPSTSYGYATGMLFSSIPSSFLLPRRMLSDRIGCWLVYCRIWWLHGIRMSMFGRNSVLCSVRFSDVHVCSPRLRQFTDYRSPSHPCRRRPTRLVSFLPRDSAKRGIEIACRRSIRLSVTLVDQDHIGWKSWKLIVRTISPTSSLFA